MTMKEVTVSEPIVEDEAGASRILKISVRKLQRMRATGTGPDWFKVDRLVRYPIEGLHAWVAEQQRDGRAA